MLSKIQVEYNIPKLVAGDFNFLNIKFKWYETIVYGANVRCCDLLVPCMRICWLNTYSQQDNVVQISLPLHLYNN